jgi:ubiquinone biosynthesis protein UbiJ
MVKSLKRPRDPISLAKMIGDIATGQVADDSTGKSPNRAKGGTKGGRARADRLTSEERSNIARAAAQARWKKGKG